MNTTVLQSEAATGGPKGRTIDMKLEVTVIPVSDVERAKRFYGSLGWRLDADFDKGESFRGVQMTPPGSSCSIHFGRGITSAAPGSAHGLFLAVSDIEAARAHLMACDVAVSEIFHRAPGEPPKDGLDPERHSYASFATFKDPDGNTWLLQEVTARAPGRVDAIHATFTGVSELALALRRAASAHHVHELRIQKRDTAGWPEWYAEYMVAEQTGKPLPT
ncbi:MAG: VOC family protein [Burkholderiaceae bacterium]|nr:VOC family protein [Burkholderiaceae bacterium]